jgi:hypothetical protein
MRKRIAVDPKVEIPHEAAPPLNENRRVSIEKLEGGFALHLSKLRW